MTKPFIRMTLAAAGLWSALAGAAWAGYPDKPIRFEVPFAAGGGVDNITRVIVAELGKRFNQTIIVENRAGANANIGTDYVVKAAPDGYTLLMGATFLGFNRATMSNLPYDAAKDLVPVARTGVAPFVLVVPATLPAKNVAELVAYMKAHPDTVSYGAVGAGSPTNLIFPKNTGTKPVQVLYKGGSSAMPDLIAGRLTFMIQTSSEVVPLIESGKLRALAVTGPTRFKRLPDVPTMNEAGVSDLEGIGWWGVFAPADTPKEIVQRLSDEIGIVMRESSVIEALAKLGIESAPMPVSEFASFYRKELQNYADIAKQFNLKVE